jgi:hypothetical protein
MFRMHCSLAIYPRCLAHIINLATQALIKGHSKAKHYNPALPDEHIPSTEGIDRDEIGLVRAIAVKVRTAHPTHPTYSECWSGTFICETQRTFPDGSSRESCRENQNRYE